MSVHERFGCRSPTRSERTDAENDVSMNGGIGGDTPTIDRKVDSKSSTMSSVMTELDSVGTNACLCDVS